MKENNKNIYEIVVFGAAGVGKTSIIRRFYLGEFTNVYNPTVEDCYSRVLNLNGKVIVLNTTDTSGSYQFPAMRQVAINRASGFIMVYSLDNRYSFVELKRLFDEIVESKPNAEVPIILVGNKRDMKNKRQISSEQVVKDITEYIRSKGTRNFKLRQIETSAKDNYNIEAVFKEMIEILTNIPCDKSCTTKPKKVLNWLRKFSCTFGSYTVN
ncbi:GTP-binding protein Di-Ras2-like [Actinia tenebrosa]|uniref:GTP-binding protein Di-Ras2-like n=1 Tax=Actinia tenebrosa TaxID=6105 RepID=A0A6P8IBK5_ACTTE|nr:GTP-binding protein Di-Ras2-like [Actinia tenebrosa]